jgi:hypothetical protein
VDTDAPYIRQTTKGARKGTAHATANSAGELDCRTSMARSFFFASRTLGRARGNPGADGDQ